MDEFGVFISHGGSSNEWKDLALYINSKFDNIKVYELAHQLSRGKKVIDKLGKTICEYTDFAIIVVTGEDEMKDGTFRPRPNVIHEIGYCQGVLGQHNVLILKEKGVELFSNVHGIVYESFDRNNIRSTFAVVADHLEEAYEDWENDDLEYGDCKD